MILHNKCCQRIASESGGASFSWVGKLTSPIAKGSGDEDDGAREVVGNNTYHPGTADVEYDELHVRCPPHTTERHIVTRIDWRLVPFLCILYLLAFLDRVNIANARSFHLLEDLGMEGLQYNTGKHCL